jgi:hypothetical protein
MPLRDHFHPPLSLSHPWTGFHSFWASAIAQQLNEDLLPEDYYAMPNVQLGGQVEIDVATFEKSGGDHSSGVATAVWAPPRPALTAPVDFLHWQVFEVQVFQNLGGPQLRAAIELVSPANKDRPSHRETFAWKCGGLLERGVSLVVIDVVTERLANLHADLMRLLELGDKLAWQSPSNLYAIAYRTVRAANRHHLEIWPESLSLGRVLPTLPLWLDEDNCVPLHLEESYQATCDSLRVRE